MPRESIFLEIFDYKSGEHQFANYNEENNSASLKDKLVFFDKSTNKILSYWRIPSFKEIIDIEWDME